jgi:Family of unknown function (DUF6049)
MKRLLALLAALILTFIATPVAHAGTTIFLTEPSHRQINGDFIDDALADSISFTGRLGQLVFNPPAGERTWVIDPALVEDVTAMAGGYTLASGVAGTGSLAAKSWLTQLKLDTRTDPVLAMAYGNPSSYWVNQLSPHEANYLLTISQSRLSTLLGINVPSAAAYYSNSHFSLSSADVNSLKDDASQFAATASYIAPTNIDLSRLALIRILNPYLTADRRGYLIRDFTSAAFAQMHLVHLGQGKFTVTSTHQNLPITLTNGFPTDVKVNLYVIPTNLKVEVGSLPQVVIPAKSKIQVMIPITVLTSGTSGLNVEITSTHGALLGDSVIYPLQLSVISPVATWFTTGAALVLFIAATFQSIRRIRRRQR